MDLWSYLKVGWLTNAIFLMIFVYVQRVIILPKGTIKTEELLQTDVQGVISRV